MSRNYFFQISTLLTILPLTLAYPNPLDKSLSIPYGRQLRAILSGRIPPVEKEEEAVSEELQWWHSVSRNNTIDCKCGDWRRIEEGLGPWVEEGIDHLNEYSWSVSLVAPGTNYAFCGGSLINDRWVMTSASCVDGSIADGVEVLVGSWPKAHFVQEADPDELNTRNLVRKKVHRVILHPKYSQYHLDYNIALLRLLGPVQTFGEVGGIVPVCLPKEGDNFDGRNSSSLLWRFHDQGFLNEIFKVCGFGIDLIEFLDGYIIPIKRTEVTSELMSQEECRELDYNKEWGKMPGSMMCAKMEDPVEGHPYAHTYDCPGDNGGFLVTERDSGQKVQVGVDSWTACYGRPKGVGVFTRVSEFLPWINLHIGEDGRRCAY